MIKLNEKVIDMLVDAVVYDDDNNIDDDRFVLNRDDGNRDRDDLFQHDDNKIADNDVRNDDRDADMRYYECSGADNDYYGEPVEEYKSFSSQPNTTQSSSSISLLSKQPPSSSSQQQQLLIQQEKPLSTSSSSSTTKEEQIDIELQILLANNIFGDNNLNRRSTRQVKKRDFDGFLDSTEHLSLKKLKENDGLFFLSSKTNSNGSGNRNKNSDYNNNNKNDNIVDNKNVKRKKSALLSSLLQQNKNNLNNNAITATSLTTTTTDIKINNDNNNNNIVNSGDNNNKYDINDNSMKTTMKRGRGKPRKQPPPTTLQIHSDYDNTKIISTTSSITNCISHLNAFVNLPITSPSRIISSSSSTTTSAAINNNNNDCNDNDDDGLMKSVRKRSNLHNITPMLVKMADEKYKHEFQTIDSLAATKANISTTTAVAKRAPLITSNNNTSFSTSATTTTTAFVMTQKLTRKGRGKAKPKGKIMSLSLSPQSSSVVIDDVEVITEKNVSKQRRKPYITQRILNAMTITNNNNNYNNKSYNDLVNSTSSNNYNIDTTTNNDNIETIFTSFILALKNENYVSSNKAKNMLCRISPHLRFIMLNIISLGFYYSRSSQRVELHKKWKGMLKIDKIKISANYWATNYLNLQYKHKSKSNNNDDTTSTTNNNNNNNDIVELIDLMGDFFLSCWNDYNKNSVNLHKKLCKVKKL